MRVVLRSRAIQAAAAIAVSFILTNLSHAAPIPQKTLVLANIKDVVWDATRQRFFISNGTNATGQGSVVMVNPETAQIEDTIATGPVFNRIAISKDGKYLYVGLDDQGVVRRYSLETRTSDLEIPLGKVLFQQLTAAALLVPNDQPQSVIIARRVGLSGEISDFAVYDGAIPRPNTAFVGRTASGRASLYFRESNQTIYGYAEGQFYWLALTPSGLTATKSAPGFPSPYDSRIFFGGPLVTDDFGFVFDLDAGSLTGRVPLPDATGQRLAIGESSGQSLLGVVTSNIGGSQLARYSAQTFRTIALGDLGPQGGRVYGSIAPILRLWGQDGIALASDYDITFIHASALSPTPGLPPAPSMDPTGVIRLQLPVNDLAFDPARNVLWASVRGSAGNLGNTITPIDPTTGTLGSPIDVGSEPGPLAMTDDGTGIFAGLLGNSALTRVNLATKTLENTQTLQNPPSNDSNYWIPSKLVPFPGHPQSVVALRRTFSGSGQNSLVLYDKGGPRAKTFSQQTTIFTSGDGPSAVFAQSDNLYRLFLGDDGLTVDRQLPGPAGLVYANGYFYTTDGAIWALNGQLVGYPANGGVRGGKFLSCYPVPFPDQNIVVYVTPVAGLTYAISAIDLSTLRLISSITITPLNQDDVTITVATRAGNNSIAFALGHEVFIVPLSTLISQPIAPLTLTNVAPGVQRASLAVSSIAAQPGTSNLLVATPSASFDYGNSLVVLDPASATVKSVTAVGSRPTNIAPSPDGRYAYVYASGSDTIARVNLASGQKDLAFPPVFKVGDRPVPVFEIAVGKDGGLAVSEGDWTGRGGKVAIFDNGELRPQVDFDDGPFTSPGSRYGVMFDESGQKLYGYGGGNSYILDLKRWQVSGQGLVANSISEITNGSDVTTGPGVEARISGGLLYTNIGEVIDPERTRRVGRFVDSNRLPGFNLNDVPSNIGAVFQHGAPDSDRGRIYFIADKRLLVYDIRTFVLLSEWTIPNFPGQPLNIVKWSSDGLAINTADGSLYLIKISAIPLLPTPIPSEQPRIPATEGVNVIDLEVRDLVYDPARDKIYATVPRTEGILANRIIAIDPASGVISAVESAGASPRRIEISSDNSELYYTEGFYHDVFTDGKEGVHVLDLGTGMISPKFATTVDDVYVQDIAPVRSQHNTLAVSQNSSSGNLKIYDGAVARPNTPLTPCMAMVAGGTPDRLYCYDGSGTPYQFARLGVDENGANLLALTTGDLVGLAFGSSRPNLWEAPIRQLVYDRGRVYATNGRVIDPETFTIVGSVAAKGPVAVDSEVVYWLDPNPVIPGPIFTATLRSFDRTTLTPLSTKLINLSRADVTALTPVGRGRLAFRAGHEIYIIYPDGSHGGTTIPSVQQTSCNVDLKTSGQIFPATGGDGSIGLTMNTACFWNTSNSTDWITIVGSTVKDGLTTLQYRVAANAGADRIGTLNIGGLVYTVEQQAAAVSGLNFMGSMPQVASAGTWETTFTLVNTGSSTATAHTDLFGDDGTPLSLPLTFPQTTGPTPLIGYSVDRSIGPNGTLLFDTTGPDARAVQVGSAQLSATGTVGGFAIFKYKYAGQEAVVPLETRKAPAYLLAFDNTNSVALGVALQNISAVSGTIPVVIRDEGGAQLGAYTLTLPGNGHLSFVLPAQYPVAANRRGTVEFDTPVGGQISVLGIRFTPPGTLTTIPVLANVTTTGGTVAHFASGGGWKTSIVLVNTGSTAAQAHLKFFDDSGNPLVLPLKILQMTSTSSAAQLDQTLAGNASLLIESGGPDAASVRVGSVQLTTNGNIGGYVIFRYMPNGQEASVPFQNLGASAYIIPFDHTGSIVTGLAVNNASGQFVNIPVVLRDDQGNQIGSTTLLLDPNGHTAFELATRFPVTTNLRGTIEFDTPSGAQINVLGIRTPPTLTFTTLPAVTR